MIVATSLLLFVFISQDFPTFVECKKHPRKCFACTSSISSRLCGDNFQQLNYLIKDCQPDAKYCMKIVEKTDGHLAVIYRKCSSLDCAEESKIRDGKVSQCSLCNTTLCNQASVLHHTTNILFSAVLLYYYIRS